LALQHPHPRRPAAGPDRQSGAGGDRGRGQPGPRQLPLLRRQAGHLRSARVLGQLRGGPAPRRGLSAGAGGEGRRPDHPPGLMRRLAVLGFPIEFSRSPAIHNTAFAALGMEGEWSYEAIEVPPDRFAERVRAMQGEGFVGANVTVPHKGAALLVSDRRSGVAREIGAANTLIFEDDEIRAENTDARGLMEALPESPAGRRALVLGAGG